MKRCVILLGACLLLATSPGMAHRAHFSLTDMWWRVDRSTLEITHSIHLDDAMVLLASLGAPDGTLDAAVQAKLMHYLERTFSLTSDGDPLELEPVGAQIEGDFLWLYQELELAKLPDQLQLSCQLMQDFSAEQVNQVNFRVGDEVRTLRLNRDRHAGQLF